MLILRFVMSRSDKRLINKRNVLSVIPVTVCDWCRACVIRGIGCISSEILEM